MSTTRMLIKRRPRKVFGYLVNPRTYPKWLVGAKEIRKVEGRWPRRGAAFHHSLSPAGAVKDKTMVVDSDPPRCLELKAFARPFGIVMVRFTLRRRGLRSTEVTISERPAKGTRLRRIKLLVDPLVSARNRKSLEQLRDLIERR